MNVRTVRVLSVLLLILCLSPLGYQGSVKAAPAAAEPVKVGVLLALSGPFAGATSIIKTANEMAAKEINDAGGIKSLGGAPLQLVFVDGQGRQEVALGETERAIQQEKVLVMTGGWHSASVIAATTVTERLKTPFLVQVAAADIVTERGFKYVSRYNVKASQFGHTAVQFLDYLNKEKGAKIKRIGLIFEDGDWGQSVSKGVRRAATELAFDSGIDLSYPAFTTQDMTPFVSRIRASNVDAFVAASFIADAMLLGRTTEQMGLDLNIIRIGTSAGYVDPRFADNLGPAVRNWIIIDAFNPDLPGYARVVNDRFREYSGGLNMNGFAAQGYQGVMVIADALERAASRNKDTINKAIRETVIRPGPKLILPYRQLTFDEHGNNPQAALIVVQHHEGGRRTVWPKIFATAEPIVRFRR